MQGGYSRWRFHKCVDGTFNKNSQVRFDVMAYSPAFLGINCACNSLKTSSAVPFFSVAV
jgi:hypothetical protein